MTAAESRGGMRATEVVVIGAGVTGLSVAFHLAEAGAAPLVLERAGIAAEASGVQPGGVRQQWSARLSCELAREALGTLWMMARRVEAGQRWVGQDVDRVASTGSAGPLGPGGGMARREQGGVATRVAATRVSPETRVKDLTDAEVAQLRDYISQNYKVEGDLRRETQLNIKRLIEIGSYRGLRHRRNLPVNGQRTRTNAGTRKGPKKTVAGRGRRRGAKKK